MRTTCPCGQPAPFAQCCGPIIDDDRQAITATELMRSRFSAFATGTEAATTHLIRSWDPATCPPPIDITRSGADDGRVWVDLTIHEATGGGAFDATGTVYFTATFRDTSGPTPQLEQAQTENSSFRRLAGRWVYVGAS